MSAGGDRHTCVVCGREYQSYDGRGLCPVCWPGFDEPADTGVVSVSRGLLARVAGKLMDNAETIDGEWGDRRNVDGLRAAGDDGVRLADILHGLIDPPTPSAEPTVEVPESVVKAAAGHLDREGYHGTATLLLDTLVPEPTTPIEPPSIADMAPGTTFRARHVQGAGLDDREVRWTVESAADPHGPLVESETGTWRYTTVDPSTIRDVTPPAATPGASS